MRIRGVVCFSIVLLAVASIASAGNLPFEVDNVQWRTVYRPGTQVVEAFVDANPQLEMDYYLTTQEYGDMVYWRERHAGKSAKTADSIAEHEMALYDNEFPKQTLQFWVRAQDTSRAVLAKMSVDLNSYKYRVIKLYILDSQTYKQLEMRECKDAYVSFTSNSLLDHALKYLRDNRLGYFAYNN